MIKAWQAPDELGAIRERLLASDSESEQEASEPDVEEEKEAFSWSELGVEGERVAQKPKRPLVRGHVPRWLLVACLRQGRPRAVGATRIRIVAWLWKAKERGSEAGRGASASGCAPRTAWTQACGCSSVVRASGRNYAAPDDELLM